MIELVLIVSILGVLFAFAVATYRYQCRKAQEYRAEQTRLAQAREEAIENGTIFSARNFRQIEERLMITHPHLNRRQRKEKAFQVRQQFISDVKAGLM